MKALRQERAAFLSLCLLASACGHTASTTTPQPPLPAEARVPTRPAAATDTARQPAGDTGACDPARDRQAILAMAGRYKVGFRFREALPFAAGYEVQAPYHSEASEVVLVIEDSPHRISLQHILMLGDGEDAHVLKHWRQDWRFEDRELLEYRGHQTWQHRRLGEAEAECTWTQAVFQVDDGPRYEGYGRWVHHRGISSWTSNPTWRPLPRRERSRVDDYDVLVGVNRHTLTAEGWAHEQDNVKLVLGDAPRALVREHGLNRYQRAGFDASAAHAYWERTRSFWANVRDAWNALFAERDTLTLRDELEGKPRHARLFELEEALTGAGRSPTTEPGDTDGTDEADAPDITRIEAVLRAYQAGH